jgi:hypothetical protein
LEIASIAAAVLNDGYGSCCCRTHTDGLREINRAASTITVQGARYPERLEQMTGG